MVNNLTVCKSYNFSSAHFLKSAYDKKCHRLHGHNYSLNVCLRFADFEKNEFFIRNKYLIDFDEIDEIIKPIVNSLDHYDLTEKFSPEENISAEFIALWIYNNAKQKFEELLSKRIDNFKIIVELKETEKSVVKIE